MTGELIMQRILKALLEGCRTCGEYWASDENEETTCKGCGFMTAKALVKEALDVI